MSGRLDNNPADGSRLLEHSTRMGRLVISSGSVLVVIGGTLVSAAGPAGAISSQVTTTADSGPGSLREAIASADDGDTITFAPALAGQTIELASELRINEAITIDGLGAGSLTVDANGAGRAFYLYQGTPMGPITITGLTITGGDAADGGGIHSLERDVVLDDVDIEGNAAENLGGGIFLAGGQLTLTSSTVSGNTASHGGGINLGSRYAYGDTSATITNTTVEYNTAQYDGGGVALDTTYGTVNIMGSHIDHNDSDNGAGGGIDIYQNAAPVTITNTTISHNHAYDSGGGVNIAESYGAVTINGGSTISDNHVYGEGGDGGGVAADAPLRHADDHRHHHQRQHRLRRRRRSVPVSHRGRRSPPVDHHRKRGAGR